MLVVFGAGLMVGVALAVAVVSLGRGLRWHRRRARPVVIAQPVARAGHVRAIPATGPVDWAEEGWT